MICQECVNGNTENCWGKTRNKTWCDSQHIETSAVMDPTVCQHLRIPDVKRVCPTCSATVPLTMTKAQAKCLLEDYASELEQNTDEDGSIVSRYAERILNDRPTRSAIEAKEASTSEL